jgi:hypothetical protein
MCKFLTFCLFILLLPLNNFAAEKAGDLFDEKGLIINVIKAYGGKETIIKNSSILAKGKIRTFMVNDEGTYVRYFMRDRKLRVETSYRRGEEIRILNGSRGWRGKVKTTGADMLKEVTGHRLISMVYQYKQLDLPHGFLNRDYTIRMTGKEELDGAGVAVLELTDKEGPPMTVSIDLKKYYIRKVVGHFKIGEKETALAAKFDDFRIIKNMPFPFLVTNYAGGYKIGETLLEEYAVNPKLEDSLFSP